MGTKRQPTSFLGFKSRSNLGLYVGCGVQSLVALGLLEAKRRARFQQIFVMMMVIKMMI